MLLSSHWLPASTYPARKATFAGYHIIRHPAPDAGMMPWVIWPSAITPPAESTRRRSVGGEPERSCSRMSDWAAAGAAERSSASAAQGRIRELGMGVRGAGFPGAPEIPAARGEPAPARAATRPRARGRLRLLRGA